MSTPLTTDLMLVERGGALYKCTKSAFDAGITSSDLILVERSSTLYKETYANRANIDATDLVMTERSDVNYKCAWSDWSGSSGAGFTGVGQDINTANYSPSVTIYHQNLSEGSGDTNRAFDIKQFQVHAGAETVTGHLYMGWKNNAYTTYYGDICIGVVQILNSAKNTLRYAWHGSEYRTANQAIDRSTSIFTGSSSHTYDPSTMSYTTPSWGLSVNYWSQANWTGSSYTGANNGISFYYSQNSSGTILNPGTVSQYGTNAYWVVEQSGSSRYTLAWCRMGAGSGTITLNNGDYITVAYLAATYSSNGSSSANSLWFRFK